MHRPSLTWLFHEDHSDERFYMGSEGRDVMTPLRDSAMGRGKDAASHP